MGRKNPKEEIYDEYEPKSKTHNKKDKKVDYSSELTALEEQKFKTNSRRQNMHKDKNKHDKYDDWN